LSDYAAFQAQLVKKAKYWISLKYPQETVPVETFENLAPPTPLNAGPVMWSGEYANSISDFTMLQGYGKFTAGEINVVQGDLKSFGVTGQGTAVNMGYIFPVEDTTSASTCTEKFVIVNVYPTPGTFDQAGADVGTFTITASAEAAKVIDDTVKSSEPSTLFQSGVEATELLNYQKYFAAQENAEFLGALNVAAFASASIASVAALTLF